MPEFDHDQPVTVAVRCPRGRVDLVAADHGTVHVQVAPLDDTDAARRAAEATTVTLEGDTLAVRVPSSSGWGVRRSPRLAVTVRVPAGSSFAADLADAELRATGRFATVHAKTASGAVHVEEATGDVHVQSASGAVTVGRAGGALRVSSSSGELTIGDVTGDVKVDSASGDITVRSAGASVKAGTASGDLRIGAVRQGRASLRTASGDIAVGVTRGTGVWLDVDSASGRTTNGLSMHGDVAAPGVPTSLELRIRSASGDITIGRVPASADEALSRPA